MGTGTVADVNIISAQFMSDFIKKISEGFRMFFVGVQKLSFRIVQF